MIRAVLITLNYTTERLQDISLHSNHKWVFSAKSKQHILLLALWHLVDRHERAQVIMSLVHVIIPLICTSVYFLTILLDLTHPFFYACGCILYISYILAVEADKINSPQTLSESSNVKWSVSIIPFCVHAHSQSHPTVSETTSSAYTVSPCPLFNPYESIWIDFKIKALGHNSTGEEIKDTSRYKAILSGILINILNLKSSWNHKFCIFL